jgi:pimeloyl-ACP methyl ester carboxylesterase
MRISNIVLGSLLLAGCSQIATVRHVSPQFSETVGIAESQLSEGQRYLIEGRRYERSEPTRALGEYLAAARIASVQLDRQPTDTRARDLYNFAVARCIDVVETAPLDPWSRSLTVKGPDGKYVLTTVRHPGADRNPADYEIIPSDELVIGGTFLQRRVTVEGIGAPVVAIGREEKPDFRKALTSRRLYGGPTAIVRFEDRRARLEFLDPFSTERVTIAGARRPVAADFTAPLAIGLTRERPEKLGLSRMLNPGKFADTARLTRLQPYDASRIPVIFVHGLQDTPVSWVPMINTLRDDPEIRRRYQFWVYSYPSGYPYPYSAELFRQELDSVSRAFPDHKGIVLIGHSMGGVISRVMVTDAGDRIWRDYFGTSPAETNIPGPSKKLLEECLIFNHRPEVRRVIFMSAPHRGALMATNWIGRIGTKLIRTPFFLASLPIQAVSAASVNDPAAAQLNRIPTSIDTLSPKNRFVREINKFPIAPGIPYHSIIGDRGRGDTPNSSDGVVAYWSSHLDGAKSELIVPSAHASPRSPQGIAEVRRILKLHLREREKNENVTVPGDVSAPPHQEFATAGDQFRDPLAPGPSK